MPTRRTFANSPADELSGLISVKPQNDGCTCLPCQQVVHLTQQGKQSGGMLSAGSLLLPQQQQERSRTGAPVENDDPRKR